MSWIVLTIAMYAPNVPGVGTYLNDSDLEREAVWRSCHSNSGPMDLRGDPTYQPEVDGHTVVKIMRGIRIFFIIRVYGSTLYQEVR